MAIGFPPKYEEFYPLNGLDPEHFLVLAVEAALKAGWGIQYICESGLIAHTNLGAFSWNAIVHIKIVQGMTTIKSASADGSLMDLGKNKKNVKNFISSLDSLKSAFSAYTLATKYEGLQRNFISQDEFLVRLSTSKQEGEGGGFFSIFIPKPGFFFTPILIDLNILVFLVMVISGVPIFQTDNESLLNWGANYKPLTLDGDWWRLLTNCFLHIGIFHLLMNMYALFYIGILLEPHLGKSRFITAYFLAGLTASLASLWWHDRTISAGASGAIFGMYGVFLAMLTSNLIEKQERMALLTSIGIFVIYNLIYGLTGGIDNAGHIGGLTGGLAIGYAFLPGLKKPGNKPLKWMTIGSLTVFVLAAAFAVLLILPKDMVVYDKMEKEFFDNQEVAMGIFHLPETASNEERLFSIKEKGIEYWQKNVNLMDSMASLKLPKEIKTRNKLLKEYCELRIKSYGLLHKAISENSHQYDQEIVNYNLQIENKLKELD